VATKLTGRLTGGIGTLMHDSSTCPICRTLPAGAARWFYEMADGSLAIGYTRFGMMPRGTYSAAHQSWLWAWANEEFPPVAKESAATCETAGNVFTGQHR
jgi:hypothetical protein